MPQMSDVIVFPAANQVEIRQVPLPPMAPNEVLVKTLYTMVSSGTELRVFSGRGEAEGRFPIIPGYCVVGEVIEVGPEAKGWKVGDRVSGRNSDGAPDGIALVYGGQRSHHVYSADSPILLPPNAAPLDYAVAEVAAISLRGVDMADPQPGETAVVIGQGLVGALAGAWLVAAGCRVIVADRAPARLERATRWGIAATIDANEDVAARVAVLCPGGPDIVVEASATVPGLKTALSLVRPMNPVLAQRPRWPRLVIQASFNEEVPLHPTGFFPGEGALILTPGDRRPADRAKAVEGLRQGLIRGSDFLDAIVPYRQAPNAYARLRDDPNGCFSLVFDWSQA